MPALGRKYHSEFVRKTQELNSTRQVRANSAICSRKNGPKLPPRENDGLSSRDQGVNISRVSTGSTGSFTDRIDNSCIDPIRYESGRVHKSPVKPSSSRIGGNVISQRAHYQSQIHRLGYPVNR